MDVLLMYHNINFNGYVHFPDVKIWYDENIYPDYNNFVSNSYTLLFRIAIGDILSNLSKKDGPYVIEYNETGNIIKEIWIYKGENCSEEVNEWIQEKGFDSWENMCEYDFYRMWMEIL